VAQAHRHGAATTAAPLTPSTTEGLSEELNHAEVLNSEPSRPTGPATVTSSKKYTICERAYGIGQAAKERAAADQAASAATSSANTPVSTYHKNSRVETKTINFAGNFYFHSEHRLANNPKAVTRSVTHKTRYFGQSHWVNAVGLVGKVSLAIDQY
jgi:hypothetical protein